MLLGVVIYDDVNLEDCKETAEGSFFLAKVMLPSIHVVINIKTGSGVVWVVNEGWLVRGERKKRMLERRQHEQSNLTDSVEKACIKKGNQLIF